MSAERTRLSAESRDVSRGNACCRAAGSSPFATWVALLDVPESNDKRRRISELERLRKGVFRCSSKGMVAALRRLAAIEALGAGRLEVSTVPPRRLLTLATHGMSGKATLLRRLPREHKLAAAVKVLLALEELDPNTGLAAVWELIENEVPKHELRAAVAVIDELVPPTDAELDGQRMEELAGRLATVRPF